jgi:hypothetical protein
VVLPHATPFSVLEDHYIFNMMPCKPVDFGEHSASVFFPKDYVTTFSVVQYQVLSDLCCF